MLQRSGRGGRRRAHDLSTRSAKPRPPFGLGDAIAAPSQGSPCPLRRLSRAQLPRRVPPGYAGEVKLSFVFEEDGAVFFECVHSTPPAVATWRSTAMAGP